MSGLCTIRRLGIKTMSSENLKPLNDDDIPEMTDDEIMNADYIVTTPQTEVAFLSISRDVMEHFRNTGKGYMMRLSSLVDNMLRDYVNTHAERSGLLSD